MMYVCILRFSLKALFNNTYAISQYNDNLNLTYLVSYNNNYILYILAPFMKETSIAQDTSCLLS